MYFVLIFHAFLVALHKSSSLPVCPSLACSKTTVYAEVQKSAEIQLKADYEL